MREGVRNWRMRPKKSLGQYSLRCSWVVSTLIRAAELDHADTVLEIGPGTGALTRRIAPLVRRVIAVEKDERLAEELADALRREGIGNVTLIAGDILVMLQQGEIANTLGGSRERYKAIGNIPYYLTSRLIRMLLEQEQKPGVVVMTIQKEVARRIAAKPPKMNLFALAVQAFGKPEIIKDVPAQCFFPRPKVDSAIIKISDISKAFFEKNKVPQELFFTLIRAGFSQKRKILASNLAKIADKHAAGRAIAALGLSEKIRAEELSPAQWLLLIKYLSPQLRL